MPLFGAHRLGGLLDRLLRPDQAARNAEHAAADATDTVLERQAVELEVEEITDSSERD